MIKFVIFLCVLSQLCSAQTPLTRFDTTTAELSFYRIDSANQTALAKSVFSVTIDGKSPGGLTALTPVFGTSTNNASSLVGVTSGIYVKLTVGGQSSPTYTSDAVDPVNGPPPYIAYNGNIVPILTALVSMTNGVVDTVAWNWDDESSRCSGCSDPDVCVLNYYCAIPKCTDPDPITSTCQLRVYVAWVGTDVQGRYCTSSNTMFSKFTALGVQNLAAQAKSGASSIIAGAQQQLSKIGG